jgi:PAS domain S-box-containing protein
MNKNTLWITGLSLFAALCFIGRGLSVWNRRLTEAMRERKKLAGALADAKSQMASWVKIFPGAVYRSTPDPDRTMVFVSDAIESVTGYPALDFTSRIRRYPQMIHPEDQAMAVFQIEQGLKRDRCFEVEYRVTGADGKTRRILEKGVGAGTGGHDDAGSAYEWIDGAIMDITGSRQTEEMLRRIAGMFRSLVDAMTDSIFFKDRKGVYLECNKAFAESIGKEPAWIIGKTDYDLFNKELADRLRESDLKMLSKLKPRRTHAWFTRADGKKVLLETLKTPLLDADGKVVGLVGVSRDVTLIKRLAQEIRRLKAEG